jgi:anthranilate synthase component 1
MGYISRDGGSDFNILIRTMTTKNRDLTFATGSGIVADSDPLQELEETRAKAKGLLLALESDAGG